MEEIKANLARPNEDRVWHLRYAIKAGLSNEKIHELSYIDPWFLDHLFEIVELEEELLKIELITDIDNAMLRKAKQFGYSDRQLAEIFQTSEMEVREFRKSRGIVATFRSVCSTTCGSKLLSISIEHSRGT